MKFTLGFLALASVTSAHFLLDFPLSRGFDEDIEPQFCGGFNKTLTPRQVFPLNGGPIVIDSRHATAVVGVQISFDANPTSFAQFNVTPTGSVIPFLKPFGTIQGQGIFCFPGLNVSALGVPGVGNGTLATIQVLFNGGDGVLLQCTDVILSSTYTASNVTCANSTAVATPSTSSSTTAVGAPAAAATTTPRVGGATSTGVSVAGLMLAAGVGLVGLVL